MKHTVSSLHQAGKRARANESVRVHLHPHVCVLCHAVSVAVRVTWCDLFSCDFFLG